MRLQEYSKKTKLFIFVTMSIPSIALGAEPIEIGRNAAVKGTVEVLSQEQEQARLAIIKEPVFLNDFVTSIEGSSLQVLLKDSSTFTIGPKCEMVIDEFVYDPKKDVNSLSANVRKGMFRFASGKVSKANPDAVNISTQVASIGIRGTIVEILVGEEVFSIVKQAGLLSSNIPLDKSEATLVILRGPGINTSSRNRRGEVIVEAAGKTVRLTESGTAVLVTNANQEPSEPFVVSDVLIDYFDERLRTRPSPKDNFRPFKIDETWFEPSVNPGKTDVKFFTPLDSIEDTDWPSQDVDTAEMEEIDQLEDIDQINEMEPEPIEMEPEPMEMEPEPMEMQPEPMEMQPASRIRRFRETDTMEETNSMETDPMEQEQKQQETDTMDCLLYTSDAADE